MIELNGPSSDPARPFLNLLPVVDYLAANGNSPRGGGFQPTQGGWECHMYNPLDLDSVRQQFRYPASIVLSEEEDAIYDLTNWVAIRGGTDHDLMADVR